MHDAYHGGILVFYTTGVSGALSVPWHDMQVVDPGKKNVAEAAIGEKLGKHKCGVGL